VVFPGEVFKVEMEFETYLREDEPTTFSSNIQFDNTAIEFVRLESDSGIFVENPPTVSTTADGIMTINGETNIYSPQNKYLFTLYFRAKEIKSAKEIQFSWLDINIVRKCNTVSDGKLFSFIVDGLCDKVVRRRDPPLLQSVYPNPAIDVVNVSYSIPENNLQHMVLTVANQRGDLVETLMNGLPSSGAGTIQWNTDGSPSGAYYIELRLGDRKETSKVVLAR
jgi:hypothetical protein